MKLSLTGVLPWSVWSIARRLAQGGHEVTLVGLTEDTRGGGSGIRHVKLAPGEKETTRYITAVNCSTLYGQYKKATETQSSAELIPELHWSQFCL